LNAALELALQSDASNNVLSRDIGAISALAFACPIVSAAVTLAFAKNSALVRVVVATAVVAAFGFVAPFITLIAHCTSGDCL